MKLGQPKAGYNQRDEIERNRTIEMADMENHKRGRDIEVEPGRLILTDETTGTRYDLFVDNGAIILRDLDGNEVSSDARIRYAEQIIADTYGDTVSVAQKKKSLLKFGKNVDLDTAWETVWVQGGDETYVTTNAIDTISSSNAGDTQQVFIEGHTVAGTGTSATFTFVTQTATLNGQNKVVLTTPLARVSRMYNTGTTAFAGDIYTYEDDTLTGGVPNTASKIHLKILGSAGDTQSFKAATTFSNTDYFICTGGFASINKATSAAVDFEFQVRTVGSVFRPVARISLNSTGATTQQINFDPYVVVPKNADVRVRAIASVNNCEVNASFQGYLALVI